MNKILFITVLIAMALLNPGKVRASHIYGGELTYKYVNPAQDSVLIELSIFGDCTTCPAPCLNTYQTIVMRYGGFSDTLNLNYIPGSDQEITPVCPASISQTACNNPINPSLPGIRRIRYNRKIKLTYTGTTIFSFVLCCRTSNITNLSAPAVTQITLLAELNNSVYKNSSPDFTTIPTPFYCINEPQQYNPGVVDPDNDSISVEMIDALSSSGGVSYNTGFSGANPIQCVPGSLSFNSQNGQMAFTPDQLQRSVVLHKVTEYRNGVQTGSCMREMTFVVLDNCTNAPPGVTSVGNVSGGTFNSATNTLSVCRGSTAGFTLSPVDGNNDNITITTSGLPAGATASVAGNNTQAPVLSFSWPVGAATATGSYLVFFHIQDNHCPLNAKQTIAITIQVGSAGSLTTNILVPATCTSKGVFTLQPQGGDGPWNIQALQGGVPVKTWNNIALGSSLTDSLPAGTYTLHYTNTASSCSADKVFQLPNPAGPPAPLAASPVVWCINQVPTALSATAVSNNVLRWYTQPGGGTYTTTAPVPTTATAGVTNWYVSQVDPDGCESDRTLIAVQVKPLSAVPVVSDLSYCAGSPAAPLSVAGTNVIYYNSPSAGTGTTVPPTPATTAPGSTTWYVTQNSNGCESPRVSLTVTVYPLPPVPTGIVNQEYCQHAPAAPLNAVGQSLRWYTTATGGTSQASLTPSTATPGTFTYYVTQTVNGCESPRAPLQVHVTILSPIPQTDTVVRYCQFESTTALSASGQDIKWYANASGGVPLTAAPHPSSALPSVNTWYVTQNSNGCESRRLPVVVTVYAKPQPPGVAGLVVLCRNQPAGPLSAAGQNLKWYTTASGGIGSTLAPVPSTAVTGSQSFYVSQTIDGCESDRALVSVEVREMPLGSIRASRGSLCQGDTVSFLYSGNGTAAYDYSWHVPSPEGSLVSGNGQGPVVVRFDSAGRHEVSLKVDNNGCVSATMTAFVTVKPVPRLSISMQPHACPDETVRVGLGSIHPGSTESFSWRFDGGTVLFPGSTPAAGPYQVRWTESGIHVVSVVATAAGCTSGRYTDTILVHRLPQAKILSVSANTICASDSVLVTAAEQDSYQYEWTPEIFFRDQQGARVFAVVPVTSFIRLKVSDTTGCAAYDSAFISTRPCCEVLLPDAFTPNGDGRNDVFRIISKGHQGLSAFRVVNRWGKIVWSTADDRSGWDGTLGGTPQETGTYFYFLRYTCSDGQQYEKKGELTLIR